LPQLLGANFPALEESVLREHLAACDECRHAWEELTQLGKLLQVGPEPAVRIDLAALYRQAAIRQTRSSRRWRWLGLAASVLLALGSVWAVVGRLELRVTGQEFVLRWGPSSVRSSADMERLALPPVEPTSLEKREEQIEVLAAMVRAMVQELQSVEMRQRRDRADLDVRVSGIQEQSLKRWVALQKDLEALYILTQKGE
jgi:hypothetical protein